MKQKTILSTLLALCVLAFALFGNVKQANAYDFSAVSPSGHTIYYNIVEGGYQIPRVSVTYPNTSESPWGNIQKPYGNLVLPETVTYNGTTYNVAYIGEKAFQGCAGLASVVIPSFVLSINYNSFSGCESLTKVTINSDSITSGPYSSGMSLNNIFGSQVTNIVIGPVTTIGSFAFFQCSNLETVTIPSSVQYIGNCAFLNCGSLYRVFISDLTAWCRINFANETSNPLYQAHHLYLNNSLVTHVSIPNTMTSIKKYAFYGCSDLTSVEIPNSVTFIGENAFRDCTGLSSVFIPAGVSSINEGTFRGCTSLTSVDLPYLIEIGDYAFYHCNSLNNLVIPNSVVSIGTHAFEFCSSLTSVTIPSSVNTIGQHAFDACPQMTSVTINSNAIVSVSYSYNNNFRHIFGDYARSFTFGSGVTSIGAYAFWGCNHMTSVTLPGSLTSIGYSAFEHCLGLNRVQISDLNAWYAIDFANAYANPLYYANHFYVNTNEVVNLTVTSNISEIKDYAFVGYKGLHSVSIGYYVTSIGNSAFENCSGLTSVTIGNSVNTIGDDAFKDCTNLTSVTLNNSAIASADYTSSNNLKTIFGNQVTNYTFGAIVYSIGKYACYGCTGLTSLTFPNTLQTIGLHTFNGCTSLTSVTLPSSLYFIDQSAFQGCSGLNGVVISNLAAWCAIDFGNAYANPLCYAKHLYLNNNEVINLTIPSSVSEIKDFAFTGSTGLHSVTFHSDVTSIGSQAFKNCTHLSALDIPSTITSIGEYAFENCSCMTTLTLPSNMSSISHGVFYNCTGLTEIHAGATVPPIIAGSTTFGNVPTAIPVYVPLGSAPSYQAAQYWSRFTNYVGAVVPGDLTVTVPYEQEFYQSFIPGKWTSYEGQLVWNGSINKYTANLSTNIGHWYFGFVNGVFLSSHAWADIGNTNHAFWLVSPIMHLDGEYNMLSFDMALTQASGFLMPVTPGAQNNTRIFALVSTDHGLTWTKLEAWKHGIGGYTEIESLTPHATTLEYNLASYADQDIMVGFYMECTNANDAANRVHIDNFKVEGYDLTIPPTITSVETDGHSATVRWEPANPWQQDWDVYYDVNGSSLPDPYYNPSFFTMEWLNNSGRYFFVSGNTHEQVINGLEAASYYRVWVRHRDPFFGTESSWTPTTYFQTTSLCAPPQNPQVVTTQTTATITWEPGQPNQTSWYIYVYGYDDMYGHDLTSPSFTLTGLTPGSEFQASISGSCTGGDGGSESIWVEFSTDDYDRLTVNEGNETNENVVIMGDYCCMSNPMSQTQFVIPADMLTDMQYSTIKKLSFYSESDSEEWDDASFQIFITEVNTSDFVNKCEANTVDFVNWNYMTQFYNGTLSIEHHVMTITPSFGGGFYYTNGNLVVGIRQNQTGDCHQGLEWHGVNTNTTQALYNTQLAGVQCEEFLPKVTFAYEPDPYKPPTNFFAYPTSSNEVYFGWMPREGVTSYDIEVSWSPDFDEEEDQLLTGLEETDYTWIDIDYEYLFPSSTYYAHIRSHYVVDGTDHISSWSESVEFMTLDACPVPTDLTATEVGNLIVELDWTENGDATEWVIAFKAEGEIGERCLTAYDTTYTLTAPYLEPGTTYTVRVHPMCPNGGFVFSETITFITDSIIEFADADVEALCVANWNTDGDNKLSFAEAAAVTGLGEVFKNKDNIHSFDELQFFTGLTSIVENAFSGCDSLTSVVIPTDVRSIGTSAFSYCPNLASVILPNGVTTISNYAFMNDFYLTNFDFPESLRSIGSQAFDHCTSLTYLFIPASVTSITPTAFLGCSGLEYVNVAPGNTVYDSRDNCNAVIATRSNQLRIGCKTTVISNTVTSIGSSAFRANTALTSIDLPESIAAINDYAFYECSALFDVTLPASDTTIGKRAFYHCTGLQSITVEATTPPILYTGSDDSFLGVNKTIPVYVPCEHHGAYHNAVGWSEFANLVDPCVINFADADVKTLCVQNWDSNNDGELSFGEAALVTMLGEVFKNNDDITSFNELQYFTGLTVIESDAFRMCSALTAIEFPESLTTIGEYAFYGCTSLTSIFIPASVTTLTNNPFAKTGLETIMVDPANTVFDSRDDCNAVMKKANNQLVVGCKNTIIPSTALSIWDYAFRECEGLTSIYIPENIRYIYPYAFYKCSELTDVNIPSQVTKIYLCSFLDCSSLSSITIPSGVTEIQQSAFNGCSGLTEITVLAGNPPTLGVNAFANVDNAIPVYVPCESLSVYQAADGWSSFTNIQGIDCPEAQTVSLTAGANWFSINVDITLNDLKAALVAAVPGTSITIKAKGAQTAYNPNNGRWSGSITWNVNQMYIITVAQACEITLEGDPIVPAEHPVTIKNGANWIAYPLAETKTLTDAFAGFAINGDQVKSKSGTAQYNRGRWQGSILTELEPGKGYIYISKESGERTLVFPTSAKATKE